MVPDGHNGSRVVIQDPLYSLRIRDIGLKSLVLVEGEPPFDSPRLQFFVQFFCRSGLSDQAVSVHTGSLMQVFGNVGRI